MNPRRVLVVATFGGGGIHQYADEQYDRLQGRVAVEKHDMHTPEAGEGVVWLLATILRTLRAALVFVTRSPPDVVHVHTSHRFSFYRSSFYVLFAKYVWRRPVVLHVHGSSFDEFVETDDQGVDVLQSLVFDASDQIIVLSPYWKDVLAAKTDPAKICVVPNAVDPDEYDPNFERERPHVVFVSNLIERKGVRELAAAVETVQERVDREFQVSIAGSGPLGDRVDPLAERYDGVETLGYVSEERKRELLDDGTVFVLPAYAEGLPIAMLEGMAGGNAVVSTTVGAIPEVVGDENGILVEPRDPEALADALQELVEDPDRAVAMGRTNREAVCEHYSWSTATDRLLDIYAAAARDSSRQTATPASASQP